MLKYTKDAYLSVAVECKLLLLFLVCVSLAYTVYELFRVQSVQSASFSLDFESKRDEKMRKTVSQSELFSLQQLPMVSPDWLMILRAVLPSCAHSLFCDERRVSFLPNRLLLSLLFSPLSW